jgi:ribose-phosphate pyrophosphokinase
MNLKDFPITQFSGGERHPVIPDSMMMKSYEPLRAIIKNSNDLMDLILVTDILRNAGKQPDVLEIPYMPYGRQDRRHQHGSSDALRVVSKLINGLGYKHVVVYEPHSSYTNALIDNCVSVSMTEAAEKFISALDDPGEIMLVSPDKGATYRVEDLSYKTGLEMATVSKRRQPDDETWLSIERIEDKMLGKHMVVIDDICDGGATFLQLAKYVAEEMSKRQSDFEPEEKPRMSLFVAHGIFKHGCIPLKQYYPIIGTTDSFYQGSEVAVYPSIR